MCVSQTLNSAEAEYVFSRPDNVEIGSEKLSSFSCETIVVASKSCGRRAIVVKRDDMTSKSPGVTEMCLPPEESAPGGKIMAL